MSTYEALTVIKTCQVIRMLTAYAVTIGRTVARGWRVFVRSSSATRKRHRREFQIHACSVQRGRHGCGFARSACPSCGVRYRSAWAPRGLLGCTSGMGNESSKPSEPNHWSARDLTVRGAESFEWAEALRANLQYFP
jgi:hypothetical protein